MKTQEARRDEQTASGNDLDHVICCDVNLVLCGTDVTSTPYANDDEQAVCVVCEDLDDSGSPCGNPNCPYA